MFLKEFEGRELFRTYNVPVAKGVLLRRKTDFKKELGAFMESESGSREFVMKAQLLSGRRGKHGGVLFVSREELMGRVESFFGERIHGEKVEEILVQEKIPVERELYLSVTIDRFLREPVLVFSSSGGMEIEEIADSFPDKIIELPLGNGLDGVMKELAAKTELEQNVVAGLGRIGSRLYELLIKEEATLAEINPLILTPDGRLIAVDAKVALDNDALFRHPRFGHRDVRGYSPLELEAREHGLSYVELEGDIAIIGNGAGLVMATLDAVDAYGGKPANFCDVGGGATEDMVRKAMDIVLRKPDVAALFINVFGGITHCDEVASGIVSFASERNIKIPIVIRMVGTNEAEAHKILRGAGLHPYRSFEEAATKAANPP